MPRRALTAVLSVLAATALAPVATASADAVNYVALGDSYAAGPLTSFLQPGAPVGCIRGDRNYPSLIAKALKPASFKDVTCSGAKTSHMAGPQNFSVGRPNPPQLDALDADTTLVTLTLGGNDMGFSKAVDCFEVSFSDPEGSPCKDKLTADGTNPFTVKVDLAAPKMGEVFAQIRARAPKARVYVVNYPHVLPEGTGCYPRVPIAKGDAPFLRAAQTYLNTMLATQAALHGVSVVDTTEPGHDMCQADPRRRWIEGIPFQWAAPAHPNQNGSNAMSALLLAAL